VLAGIGWLGRALARWHHPRFGLVGAAELLDYVTVAGRQRELSVEMLRQSLNAAAVWPDQIRLSVNITLSDVESEDFGQASSSLARLDLFDIDELKIDRRFVSRMIEHRRDEAIVDSVVGLAQRLGPRLIAEGVENDEMAQTVAAAGIRVVQGCHYGRPAQTLRIEPFAPMLRPHAAVRSSG
jgi:EAL domain-containing protein (putative c-di-GMP-specific phosphodiesterase class I)